jgi:hypothetical protein
MPLVVPDLGEVEMLRWTLRADLTRTVNLTLHLFKNDYTPHRESVIGDFTEADFDGYAPVALDWGQWTGPNSVGGVAVSLYGSGFQTFTPATGTQDIYGYYVTDAEDEICIWAERFPTVVVTDAAHPVQVQPVMRGHSEFEPESP